MGHTEICKIKPFGIHSTYQISINILISTNQHHYDIQNFKKEDLPLNIYLYYQIEIKHIKINSLLTTDD